MEESQREAVTRVIALAVVAILLSLFAAALASSVDTRPFSDSQVAVSAAATTASGDVETVIADKLWKTTTTCGTKTRTVNYACLQTGTLDTKTMEQACSAGFD